MLLNLNQILLRNKRLYSLVEGYKGRVKELEATISKMETTDPKWISVKDRLPNEEYEVLFIEEDGCIHIGEMWESETEEFWFGRGEPRSLNVTHWMPLPPPPTTEEI